MLRLNEDNSGFVIFPFFDRERIVTIPNNKTLVYLVAFESNRSVVSNVTIHLPGDFVSDDVVDRVLLRHNVIKNEQLQSDYNSIYFPNSEIDKHNQSIKMASVICLGWSENSYELKDGRSWIATYRDLTEEGKRLYYSIKKLHNNKEIRILTFNNI